MNKRSHVYVCLGVRVYDFFNFYLICAEKLQFSENKLIARALNLGENCLASSPA